MKLDLTKKYLLNNELVTIIEVLEPIRAGSIIVKVINDSIGRESITSFSDLTVATIEDIGLMFTDDNPEKTSPIGPDNVVRCQKEGRMKDSEYISILNDFDLMENLDNPAVQHIGNSEEAGKIRISKENSFQTDETPTPEAYIPSVKDNFPPAPASHDGEGRPLKDVTVGELLAELRCIWLGLGE